MKLRLLLKSFNKDLLNLTILNLQNNLNLQDVRIIRKISLPTKIKKYSILRSPHVNKNSFEQFEIREFKGFIDVYLYNSKSIVSLLKINIPAGVNVQLKTLPLVLIKKNTLKKAQRLLMEIKK